MRYAVKKRPKHHSYDLIRQVIYRILIVVNVLGEAGGPSLWPGLKGHEVLPTDFHGRRTSRESNLNHTEEIMT